MSNPEKASAAAEDMEQKTPSTPTSKRAIEEGWEDDPEDCKKRKYDYFDKDMRSSPLRVEWRHELRDIQRRLLTTNDMETVDQLRIDNNKVYDPNVVFTREAVLDADNQEILAKRYKEEASKLVAVPRFDSLKLVQKLRQKCSLLSGELDWADLGKQAGVCFNKIPSHVQFLAGALDETLQLKPRAKQQRRRRNETVVATLPETTKTDSHLDKSRLCYMDQLTLEMRSTLKHRTAEEGSRTELDGVQFLCNPHSFTQTVENVFNYSHLVKQGRAEIGRNGNGLYVKKVNQAGGDGLPYTQAVCSFTMEDWRRLTANQTTQDLPHRSFPIPLSKQNPVANDADSSLKE